MKVSLNKCWIKPDLNGEHNETISNEWLSFGVVCITFQRLWEFLCENKTRLVARGDWDLVWNSLIFVFKYSDCNHEALNSKSLLKLSPHSIVACIARYPAHSKPHKMKSPWKCGSSTVLTRTLLALTWRVNYVLCKCLAWDLKNFQRGNNGENDHVFISNKKRLLNAEMSIKSLCCASANTWYKKFHLRLSRRPYDMMMMEMKVKATKHEIQFPAMTDASVHWSTFWCETFSPLSAHKATLKTKEMVWGARETEKSRKWSVFTSRWWHVSFKSH